MAMEDDYPEYEQIDSEDELQNHMTDEEETMAPKPVTEVLAEAVSNETIWCMHKIPLHDQMVTATTKNHQRPPRIGDDHRTTVSNLAKDWQNHREFRGCSWSLLVVAPSVTGV